MFSLSFLAWMFISILHVPNVAKDIEKMYFWTMHQCVILDCIIHQVGSCFQLLLSQESVNNGVTSDVWDRDEPRELLANWDGHVNYGTGWSYLWWQYIVWLKDFLRVEHRLWTFVMRMEFLVIRNIFGFIYWIQCFIWKLMNGAPLAHSLDTLISPLAWY